MTTTDDVCECGHTLQPGTTGRMRCVMGCRYQTERDLETAEEYEEVRYTHIRLGDGPMVQVCLWCGLLVGVDILHTGRCVGEEQRREEDALMRADWEERVAAGEFDDDDE